MAAGVASYHLNCTEDPKCEPGGLDGSTLMSTAMATWL